ncbi:MAG: hypothetical protein Q7T90_12510, partial [Thiobacillus sp.]|nr:hypothetical protein [Thiobacillus sp.]
MLPRLLATISALPVAGLTPYAFRKPASPSGTIVTRLGGCCFHLPRQEIARPEIAERQMARLWQKRRNAAWHGGL